MMLHAFFLENTKVGSTTFAAGSEALRSYRLTS